MHNSFRSAGAVAILSLLAIAPEAMAGTIYDNLGPGDSFGLGGRLLQGPDVNTIGDVDQAARFNTGGFFHEGIEVSVGINVTGLGPIAIQLWSDDGATGPLSMLATDTYTPELFGEQLVQRTFGTLMLTPSTNYWVVLDGLTVFDGAWNRNSTGANGVTAGRTAGNPWNIRNPDGDGMLSLRVVSRVQTVPEPTSIAALGLGAVAFLRRRKKA